MAVYKTISSKVVIRKVFRDLKPNHADWIDDAIEWTGEALEHIGASTQLVRQQKVLDITDHKALLPHDLYYINQVAVNNGVASKTSAELDTLITKVKDLQAQIVAAQDAGQEYSATASILHEINNRIVVLENVYFSETTLSEPLQYGSGTFHKSMHCDDCVNEYAHSKDTYIIDCEYIKTSFETGKICISYMAFPTDLDCYPLVPDDISFKEAMFWYIYKKLLLGGYNNPVNKIDYSFAEQQWKYYCTQARNAANFPDIDRYESFMNQWVRLVPNLNAYGEFFEEMNTRENYYRG
tara:strand:- start:1008 stop:1892 length:885 start_codon:yes stop_codon:yes gene_type:complete